MKATERFWVIHVGVRVATTLKDSRAITRHVTRLVRAGLNTGTLTVQGARRHAIRIDVRDITYSKGAS